MSQTISEIKSALARITSLDSPDLANLAKDSRIGVQKAVATRKKQLQAQVDELARLSAMLIEERQLYAAGVKHVAGIDEVGRGPLAGPVVAACVILPQDALIIGLNDSKKIPKSKHEQIYERVCEVALGIGIGIVDEARIDQLNIYEATKVAMIESVAELAITPDHLLVDAMTLDLPIPQTSLIKGDAKSLSIAAASIVAKVTRDRLMAEYGRRYPEYGFDQHAGYGTAQHLEVIKQYGITPIHRKTFEPIKSLLENNQEV